MPHPGAIIQRARAGSLTREDVLHLQRTIGNRAVGGLLSEISQLPVNSPDDKYEQEAERVAQQVVSGHLGSIEKAPGKKVQRKPTADASISDGVIQRLSQGEPLMPSTRSTLESNLGTDLSAVRVHSDSASHEAASALGARAFTHKSDIWLGRGESQQDLHLMAHEATHVVQQGGEVRGMVQRDKKGSGSTGPEPAPATGEGGATGDLETGLLNPAEKTITFNTIEIPAFKKDDRRGALYDAKPLIRRKNYKRGNPNQRDKWKNEIKKDTIKSKLQEKVKTAASFDPDPSKPYVFTVPTKGGKPFLIGSLDEVATELTIPYWGGRGKTPPTKLYDVDHIVELQLSDWNGSGPANELPNMELLERSANRSSGSMIATNIDNKVKGPIFMSRYGLWVDWRKNLSLAIAQQSFFDHLDGSKTVIEIASVLNIPASIVLQWLETMAKHDLIEKRAP